ncbi:MAG: ParB family chromosome partitioning protein [Cyclobacteriaceae bacterium]|jgi:ParB family chromosome partitioning protein
MADAKWKKKTGLGRGLGALLEDSGEKQETIGAITTLKKSIDEISLDQIEVNPFQPRTDFNQITLNELAESIRVQGIIQPITVRALTEKTFQLISGERRFQASKLAGLTSIPAYIRVANDQQMLEMALIENIQREDLNAIEVALSYQRLIAECNLKQEELGDRVGKNRTTVNNYLRLLKLPPDVQIGLRDGNISMGHARALVNIDNIDVLLDVYKKIVAEGLSVRKVEELVRNLATPAPIKKEKEIVDPEIGNIQQKLTSHFGTRITVKADGNNKGEIKIPFVSSDELNRILEVLDL